MPIFEAGNSKWGEFGLKMYVPSGDCGFAALRGLNFCLIFPRGIKVTKLINQTKQRMKKDKG